MKYFNLYILFFCSLPLCSQYQHAYKNQELPCIQKEFQLYVHVTRDSLGNTKITPERIQSILNSVNSVFEPICFSFSYCKLDTIIDYSFNLIDVDKEVEMLTSRFQQKKRINLYFVDFTANYAYSTFFGVSNHDNAYIIVEKGGTPHITICRELGRIFGLYLTNETQFGYELVNRSNCYTTGDLLCDTPAEPTDVIPLTAAVVDKDCNVIYPKKDANGDYYTPDVSNFMSPHLNCFGCGFTNEQYRRMAANYLMSNKKPW